MEKQMKNDFDDYMDYMKLYPISFTDATQIKFKSDREQATNFFLKQCLNGIYGSGPYSNCVVQEENKHLKAEYHKLLEEQRSDIEREYNATVEKALAKQREEMEREYKETYSMFEKRCKKYAEELAHTKADLAEANYLIKKLLLEQLQCGRPLRKGGTYNERQTEVQEAKEENRAARESKDTD